MATSIQGRTASDRLEMNQSNRYGLSLPLPDQRQSPALENNPAIDCHCTPIYGLKDLRKTVRIKPNESNQKAPLHLKD
jgi:hypothetical protein